MKKITSVADAIKIVKAISESSQLHGLWYRGIANEKFDLRPSVFRINQKSSEEDIIARLRAIRPNEIDQPLPLDTLSILQHYGAPTRLLDWSVNVLVALYFATASQDCSKFDGKLFILKPQKLNEISHFNFSSPCISFYDSSCIDVIVRSFMAMSSCGLELTTRLDRFGFSKDLRSEIDNSLFKFRCSWAVLPPLRNARLIAQHGAFTIQGGKLGERGADVNRQKWSSKDLSPEYLDASDNKDEYLSEYLIPADAKGKIFSELQIIGITTYALFPELEYMATSLR